MHDGYLSLGNVERDFRTRGHVFCCMLALKVSREMERRLCAAFGTTETHADAITLPDALRSLTRLCLLHYQVDEKTTATTLPQPDARQREILEALGVRLPALSSGTTEVVESITALMTTTCTQNPAHNKKEDPPEARQGNNAASLDGGGESDRNTRDGALCPNGQAGPQGGVIGRDGALE